MTTIAHTQAAAIEVDPHEQLVTAGDAGLAMQTGAPAFKDCAKHHWLIDLCDAAAQGPCPECINEAEAAATRKAQADNWPMYTAADIRSAYLAGTAWNGTTSAEVAATAYAAEMEG